MPSTSCLRCMRVVGAPKPSVAPLRGDGGLASFAGLHGEDACEACVAARELFRRPRCTNAYVCLDPPSSSSFGRVLCFAFAYFSGLQARHLACFSRLFCLCGLRESLLMN